MLLSKEKVAKVLNDVHTYEELLCPVSICIQ